MTKATRHAISATRHAISGLAVALAGLWGPAAQAYDADYFLYLADSNMHQVMLNQMAQSADLSRKLTQSGQGAPVKPGSASTVVRLNATPVLPGRIAATYPQNDRAGVQRSMNGLLTDYAKIEQYFGIPHGDVAGPMAAYIAGSYMAYHNMSFSNDDFRPLVTQIRNTISAAPEFQKASVAEKQTLYEQLAIGSMIMIKAQRSLERAPDARKAAQLKQAAKSGLENFLKVDADRVRLGHQGMRVL